MEECNKPLNIKKGNWLTGITTIDDVWDNLMHRGIITTKERGRLKKLTLAEQQNELDNYKQFRVKWY